MWFRGVRSDWVQPTKIEVIGCSQYQVIVACKWRDITRIVGGRRLRWGALFDSKRRGSRRRRCSKAQDRSAATMWIYWQ